MTEVKDYRAILAYHDFSDARWNEGHPLGTPTVITYSFRATEDLPSVGDIPYPVSGTEALDGDERSEMRAAIREFVDVSGLYFVEVPEGGQIDIYGVRNSPWAGWSDYPSVDGSRGAYRPVELVFDLSDSAPDTRYGFFTAIHELGHAVGLSHPHEGTYVLPYEIDTTDGSIMSYGQTFQIPDEPRDMDVDALRHIYGPTFAGLGLVVDTVAAPDVTWHHTADSYDRRKLDSTEADGPGGFGLAGGARDDLLINNAVINRMSGGAGKDSLYGHSGPSTLDGGTGKDLLMGKDGDDELHGGAQRDTLEGGLGHDLMFGDGGGDRMSAGSGDDTLVGGAGNDKLEAGVGDDLLVGGSGNDQMDGGPEDDTLLGGPGHDELTDPAGRDLLDGEAGDDRLIANGGRATLIGGDGDDTLKGSKTGLYQDDIELLNGGAGEDHLFSRGSSSVLDGGAGDDYLTAGTGPDTLHGGKGDDRLSGGKESYDILFGGTGEDLLRAGRGGAQLDGGNGDDTLVGALRTSDTFVFGNENRGQVNEILRFELSRDLLDLPSPWGRIERLTFEQDGDDAMVSRAGANGFALRFRDLDVGRLEDGWLDVLA